MKRIAWFWTIMVIMVGYTLFTPPEAAAQAGITQFPIGFVWMNTDTTLHGGAWAKFCDDTLGFNLHHIGKDSLSQLTAWSKKSGARMIAEVSTSPITLYSHAERMVYQGIKKTDVNSPSDTLTQFFFQNPHSIGAEYSQSGHTPWTHWQVTDNPSDHSNIVILDSCEVFNGPNVMWRDTGAMPFRIAVKLQVTDTNYLRTDTILSVAVKLHRRFAWWDSATIGQDTVVQIFGIRYNDMKTLGDTVIFSSPFLFNYSLSADGQWTSNIYLTVYSERWVTTRIAFVAIEDSTAHSLMAGDRLADGLEIPAEANPTDTLAYYNARVAIQKAEQQMRDSLGSKLAFYYLFDEPGVSEFASHGRVNAIIGDSGETERSFYQERRYAAAVMPKTYRNANGFATPFNEGGAPYFDKGPGWGQVSCFSTVPDTLRKYGQEGFGYFPFKSGNYVADSIYAYDTTYPLQYGNSTCNTGSTDYSFDFYDFSRFGSNPLQQKLYDYVTMPNAFEAGALCDSLVYLDTTAGHPAEWWQYTAMSGALNWDVDWKNNPNADTGYYTGIDAFTPQIMSLLLGNAICMGARGYTYWWSNTGGNPDGWGTGFTNAKGWATSDSDIFNGDTLPTMYHQLCRWAGKTTTWLTNYESQLYQHGKFLGAYVRTYINTEDSLFSVDTLKPFTESIGTNPITDPTGDSSTRYILDSVKSKHAIVNWAANAKTFRLVKTGDSLVDTVKMPQALCWETQGYFQDTTQKDPSRPAYFLAICNNFLDNRDLLCRTQPYDSICILRGERNITNRLHMDSTVSKWYAVTVLDSTNKSVVVACNGTFTWHYFPGEMHVFRIKPYFSVMAGSADETVWNNGRRSDYNGAYHVAVKQNKRISYTRSNANALGYDALTGFTPVTQIDAGVDSAKHPSVRTYDDATVTQMDSVVCVIYEGRKHDAVHNTDTIYVKLALNATDGNDSLGGAYQWKTYTVDSFALDSKYNTGYEATPVLCPMKIFFGGTHAQDSIKGYVTAWSEGTRGIGMRTFIFSNSTDPTLTVPFGSIVHVDSGIITRSSTFPTIAERAMAGSTVNNDTTDLAYEIDSSGSDIYYRGLFLSAATNGSVYTAAITPQRRECVSCSSHGGCTNVHPNIDVSYTYLYDYVPRVTWEGNETDWEQVNKQLAKLVQRTDVFTAGRKSGDWTSFVKLESQQTTNRHPSVRVYNYYQGLDTINPNLWVAAPMMMTAPGNGGGGGGTGLIVDTVTFAQPTQIGWYTNTNRLMMSKTQDGLQHFWPSSAFTRNGYVSFWYAGHWRDSGKTPTLEVNGKTALDPCWNDQREVFYSDTGSHVQIPMQAAYTDDDTVTYYGQIQTFNPSGLCGIISAITNAGATVNYLGSSQPLSFRARTDPHLFPTGMLYTDTIYVRPSLDTVNYILQHYPADTTATVTWVAGTGGQIKATLAVRSAATKNILQILDTITYSASHHAYHADTGTVSLASWMDTAIYFTVTVDTTQITGATITALSVASENGWLDDTDTLLLGKTLDSHPVYVPPVGSDPIGLTIFPNPAKGTASILFSIPVEDASDVTQLNVYDALGRDVTMLVSDIKPAGTHIVEFDGTALPSGRYMVAIKTANHAQSKLMILTK